MRVRGAIKVKCHLMFGVVALAVDQILRVTQLRPAPAAPPPRTQGKFAAFDEFCKRLGGSGFLLGFIGPMIVTPGANQGPLLGIFITGPGGFVLGLAFGLIKALLSERGRSAS